MRIKEYRKSRRLSQAEVAEAMKVSQSTIYLWESGKGKINEDQLRSLALLFQCTVASLMGHKEDELTGDVLADNFPTIYSFDLVTTAGNFSYPISSKARANIFNTLWRSDRSEENRWIHLETLDNIYLIINPNFLISVDMVDDNVEAAPLFFHEEVYNQLLNEDTYSEELTTKFEDYRSVSIVPYQGLVLPDPSPEALASPAQSTEKSLIERETAEVRKDLSEEQLSSLSYNFKVVMSDGKNRSIMLSDDNWYALMDVSAVPEGFVLCSDGTETGQSTLINQKQIVLIEIPRARLRQLEALDDYENKQAFNN